jgi:hypothetical protein
MTAKQNQGGETKMTALWKQAKSRLNTEYHLYRASLVLNGTCL